MVSIVGGGEKERGLTTANYIQEHNLIWNATKFPGIDLDNNVVVLTRHSHTTTAISLPVTACHTVPARHSHTTTAISLPVTACLTVPARHSHTTTAISLPFTACLTVPARHSLTKKHYTTSQA